MFDHSVVDRIQRIPMSWEDYLAHDGPEWERVEWADGFAIMSPQPKRRHGVLQVRLVVLLNAHLREVELMVESGLRTARSLRGPDVMAAPRGLTTGWVETAPILVAEILSPSTQSEDLLRKGPEYAEAGAGQYWVLDPKQRSLEVFTLVDGHWETLARFTDRHPVGEVTVADHGTVPIDLADLLDD